MHDESTGPAPTESRFYRLDVAGKEQHNPQFARQTLRAPGNVPYVVDNLWEWTRPPEFPSRRHCVCASPSAALARQLGGSRDGIVYRVEVPPDARLAQLPQQDASLHPDARSLHRRLVELLGSEWFATAEFEERQAIAPLWMPCLARKEVDSLFERAPLAGIREELRDSIRLWHDTRIVAPEGPWPFAEGEIFFEAAAWHLHSLTVP